MRPPLAWQEEAEAKYRTAQKEDFLLVAVPGSGKTYWTCRVLRYLKEIGEIERFVVVAPTVHVKHQWARTAKSVGLELDADFENQQQWPRDLDGVAMTYGLMDSAPGVHRFHSMKAPTAVVFDEVHHLRREASWGDRAREAFDGARRRIHLSGTPWNRKGEIPWVAYDEKGIVKWDHRYTYLQAIQDQVCCDVYFPEIGADAEWEFDGEIMQGILGQTSKEDESRALFTTITSEDYLNNLFQMGEQRLSEIRRGGQDRAGGLILAKDIEHAKQIQEVTSVLLDGKRIPIVSSEDAGSRHRIRQFTGSTDRWLIAVRMISEGVDIPRLRVLLWASHIRRKLFFEQALGRVIRGPTPPAEVILPKDPTLLRWAKEIRDQRVAAYKPGSTGPGPTPNDKIFVPRNARAYPDGVIHAGGEISQGELDEAQQLIESQGAFGVSTETLTAVARVRRDDNSTRVVHRPPQPDAPLAAERKQAKRRLIKRLVNRYCHAMGREQAEIHGELNEHVSVKKLKDATEDELETQIEMIKKWLEQEGINGG